MPAANQTPLPLLRISSTGLAHSSGAGSSVVVDDEIAIRGERDARGVVLRERLRGFTDQRREDTGIGVRPDAVAAGEQQPVPLDEDVSVGLDYGVQIRDSPRAGR
jgi:hypothetical protein